MLPTEKLPMLCVSPALQESGRRLFYREEAPWKRQYSYHRLAGQAY